MHRAARPAVVPSAFLRAPCSSLRGAPRRCPPRSTLLSVTCSKDSKENKEGGKKDKECKMAAITRLDVGVRMSEASVFGGIIHLAGQVKE